MVAPGRAVLVGGVAKAPSSGGSASPMASTGGAVRAAPPRPSVRQPVPAARPAEPPRAVALVRPAAGRSAYDDGPEVQVDTMSPESLEEAGLVLDGPPEVRFNGAPPLEGRLLAGKYRILRRLGEGGMGEVYLAEHEEIGKRVALKVLRSDQAQKTEVVERFRIEARSASRIQHPSVVQVFDFGQIDDGRFYLALEYLEGIDLAQELHRSRVLDPMRALHIALQVCGGLGAAHERGVVHRDLKPENVFLRHNRTGFDDVKIVDFGIAKMRELSGCPSFPDDLVVTGERQRRLPQAGSIFGTPEYMAPEQAAGGEIDHHADIYAVGILVYEMVSGRVPFTSDNLLRTLTQQVSEPPVPPRQLTPPAPISGALEAVILQALAKSPHDRPDSMDALAEQLQDTPEGASLLEAMRGVSPLAIQGVPSPRRLPTVDSSPSGQRLAGPLLEELEDQVVAPSLQAPLPLVTPARSQATLDRLPRLDFSVPSEAPHARSRPTLVVATTSRPGLFAGVAAVGVLTVALGSWRALSRAPSSPRLVPAGGSATVGRAGEASVAAPPSSVVPAILPSAAPSAVPSTPPTDATVTLRVVTVPEGAMIQKGDFQVCDRTPCDVVVQPDERVELTATLGELRGAATVMAQRQQTVLIRLLHRPSNSTVRAPVVGVSSGKLSGNPVPLCEFSDGDLKILRPCK